MTRRPLLALLVLLLSGCAGVSTVVFQQGRAPTCESRGQPSTPVVILEAQAVPSAALLPCIIEPLPAGWSVSDVFIHNGRARFTLDSDRAGPHAVTVVLEHNCQLPRATRVPSDEPGTRRYEEIGPLRSGVGFTGTRFYLFPGGCVTYRFKFRRGIAEPLGEVTLAISFVTRDAIRKQVREDTGGRAQLDPAAQGVSAPTRNRDLAGAAVGTATTRQGPGGPTLSADHRHAVAGPAGAGILPGRQRHLPPAEAANQLRLLN